MSTIQERFEQCDGLPDDFERHELAKGFPDITLESTKPVNRAAFEALKASMVRYGFLEDYPIVFYEGCVLDGWARYKAALAVGVTIWYAEYVLVGPAQMAEFLMAMNSGRRSLTRSELVMAGLHHAWLQGKLDSREDALRLAVELAEKWECSEQLVRDQIREFEKCKRERTTEDYARMAEWRTELSIKEGIKKSNLEQEAKKQAAAAILASPALA